MRMWTSHQHSEREAPSSHSHKYVMNRACRSHTVWQWWIFRAKGFLWEQHVKDDWTRVSNAPLTASSGCVQTERRTKKSSRSGNQYEVHQQSVFPYQDYFKHTGSLSQGAKLHPAVKQKIHPCTSWCSTYSTNGNIPLLTNGWLKGELIRFWSW